MSHSNSPAPHFVEHLDHISTLGAGDQFAVSPLSPSRHNLPSPSHHDLPSPSHQDPTNHIVPAVPPEAGTTGNHQVLLSDRDKFKSNHFEHDPLLLRGSILGEGAERQFQPNGVQPARAVTFGHNMMRGSSIVIVGFQSSQDLSELLSHRAKMAEARANLPEKKS